MQNTLTKTRHSVQTIQVYLIYRLALSALLLAMFISGFTENVLGTLSPQRYLWINTAYLGFCLASFFLFPPQSLKTSTKRLIALLSSDIAAQILLIHYSGGLDSGLGYLLIINVAIVSIFLHGQLAFALAALISLAVIGETLYLHRESPTISLSRAVFSSGTLGILIFATSIALHYFIGKIRAAAEESESQARHIRNLQEIAQNIVTRMQTGVIVVDSEMRIETINASAQSMLDLSIDQNYYGSFLADLRELAPLLKDWDEILQRKQSYILRIRPEMEIRVNLAHLESGGIPKNIFYLEDFSAIKQHAQKLKLASLGRLAASIAHEIRNPLGALSHATQLLSESEGIPKEDKRLTNIIVNNSNRVNEIVENTLALSRRKTPQPEIIQLDTWLRNFLAENNNNYENKVRLEILNKNLFTKFDRTQLRQIITNLVDNGLRFSELATGKSDVVLKLDMLNTDERAFIEVLDTGRGIPPENLHSIYEPFFTTDEKGSGLGLYICKELAEINQARLHYKRTQDNRTCFRIDFSHYQKMQ